MKTSNIIILSGLAFCAISGALLYVVRHQTRRDYLNAAKIVKIIIYPVKSLPGIEVNEATVTKSGLKCGLFRDRSWVLVNEENRFVTQRTEESLALLRQSLHDNELWIDGPNMPTLKLTVKLNKSANDIVIQTKVWGQSTEGIYCGEEAEEWFSKYLHKPGFKLIQHIPQNAMRNSSAERNDKVIEMSKFPIAFQDGSALLVINQNSINDLNERLPNETQVSHKNFRPNILITDCEAFEEDNWKYVKIRDIDFTFLKPCDRCVLTTINPDTGIKMGSEPLNTLRTYRLSRDKVRKFYGTSPLFGINLGPEKEGLISCGDLITAVTFN